MARDGELLLAAGVLPPASRPMNILPRLRGPAATLLLALAGLVSAPAQNQPPAGSATVRLPAFTVTDSPALPPPESWRYARVGLAVVLSNASDRATRNLLADFAKFTQATSLV